MLNLYPRQLLMCIPKFKFYSNHLRLAFILLFFFITSNKTCCQEIKSNLILLRTSGAITLNVTINNVSSNFNNGNGIFYNGSISIIATGGVAPYLYTLNGYTLNNGYFPLLTAGNYSIEVTDAAGLKTDTTVVLSNTYPLPSLSFSNVIVPSSCNSNDGSFNLIGTGGKPPYTYSIDGGVTFTTLNTFTNLFKGVYICLLKDANGLLARVETARGNFPNSVFFNCNCCSLNADASGYGVSSCSDNTAELTLTSEGGIQPIKYSLDGINYYNSFDGVYHFYNLSPGLYKSYAKDSAGVISVATTDISKYCGVVINYVSVDASCKQSDGAITIHATNGIGPYSYTLDGINYQKDSVFTGLSAGTYSFTVKDANGASNSSTAVVFDKCPTITATKLDETCGEKNGMIIATGNKGTQPYQFSIDGINFQTNNTFSGLAAAKYTVTVKDAGGFTSTTNVTVNNNCLQLSLNVVNTTCSNKNGSIMVAASNGTTPFQYSIDGINFVSENLFDSLAKGNYTITVKDANGLIKDSVITIENAAGPLINVAVTQASCSNTNGSINITTTGGANPIRYSVDNGISFKANNIFNSLDSGKYIAVVMDANGCTNKDTVQVTMPAVPEVFLGNDTTLCNGQRLLIGSGFSSTYKYLWQDNSTGYNYVVKDPGNYFVKVTNQFNCSASDTINIRYKSLPVFYLGNDTALCKGQTLLLKPSSLVAGSFLWNTGSTSLTLNVNSGGLYWLQVSDSGCAKTDSVLITYKPNPIIDLGIDTTVCEGKTLTLNVSNNQATYVWQDGSTLPMFIVNSAGTYSVKVDLNGCDTSAKINVSYITKPSVQLGPDTALCVNENLLLYAYYPGASYLWQDSSASPQFNVTKEGAYSVSVTNSCGTIFSSINVVYKNCACNFYIPSAFSPNNDGKNDVFRTQYSCVFTNYEMKIYNRWGQQVFISTNVAYGWDGFFKSKPQPADIYIWELKYEDMVTGKMIRKNGTVMLIR